MTEPSDKKTRFNIYGSSDHPNVNPTIKRGYWDDFFDTTKQNQVGKDFTRGDQLPDPDRNIDWDEVFGSTDEV